MRVRVLNRPDIPAIEAPNPTEEQNREQYAKIAELAPKLKAAFDTKQESRYVKLFNGDPDWWL